MDLTNVLKDCKPGEWVVLDATRTKVLAQGENPADVWLDFSRAHRPGCETLSCLLLQVPDPTP